MQQSNGSFRTGCTLCSSYTSTACCLFFPRSRLHAHSRCNPHPHVFLIGFIYRNHHANERRYHEQQTAQQRPVAEATLQHFPELEPGLSADQAEALTVDETATVTLEALHASNIIRAAMTGQQLVTTAADGSCRLTPLTDANEAAGPSVVIQVSNAPLLALALHPECERRLAAVGDMAGQLYMVDLVAGVATAAGQRHAKYVVRVAWSATGDFLASASYDQTVNLYRHLGGADLQLVRTYHLRGAVEALAFTPSAVPAEQAQLLFAARNDHLMRVVTLATPDSPATVNMNELQDEHVSFTAMSVAVSPDGQFFVVATDKNRLVLFHRATGQLLRTFYGAENDAFSQPCVCFHPSGRHIVATSQNNQVLVWALSTQRLVAILRGHTATIRDANFSGDHLLVTCGFDKTVRLWDFYQL